MHVVAWRHRGLRDAFEVAVVWPGDDEVRIEGQVTGDEEGPFSVRYVIDADARWVTRRVELDGLGGAGPGRLLLEHDGAGAWRVDGQEAPELDGCLDVDLGATILTNTLAIRRLGMNVGGAGDLRAVWVSEDLETVEPAPQRYERIHDDRYDFVALDSGERYPLVVDTDGFVVTYPNLAERLR